MPVRAVLLDFYGTLAEAVEWRPTYQEVFARHGYDLVAEARVRWGDEAYDGTEHVEHSQTRDHYKAWQRERRRQLVVECGVGADDVERLLDDLEDVGTEFTMRPYDEVPAVLAELRAGGYRVVVCSNWDWDLDRAIAAAGLEELVDVVVTSAQAGARKPHPRIYAHTLERAGVAPTEALFAGDSWGPDVEGPLTVGIRPVHVFRHDRPWVRERMPDPPPVPPGAARVQDLRGLLDLL
jgi:putative hydrolase of the HAD superfamily